MATEKISVVIPVFNAEKYLKACLDSIVDQTYTNLQVILVDDGSTDNSRKICEEYVSRDNRFEYYYQANAGQATARNVGLSHAKGEWIGFADNDDVLDKKMYEVLLRNAIEKNVLISGCATNTVYENGNMCNKFADCRGGIIEGDQLVLDILYQTKHAWGAMWNKIFHRSLLEQLRFPDGSQLEDYIVSIKLYHEVGKIYFDSNPLYNWYSRSGSQSHKRVGEDKLSIFTAAEEINEYCKCTHSEELSAGGAYFSFISFCGLIYNICRYGNDTSKIVAKQNLTIAFQNLSEVNVSNRYINKKCLAKFVAKLFLCKYFLRRV